uniref:Adenosine kinase n=1 Tax=Amphora coffeiformis TaxID=265554 RepID=A0A7S3PD39_9STRA|mmetsp:Transcript_5855/g.11460  ORF Transcript_5855/g.11460 Transcript_5855/m.11460 type:complete len:120 (-) Transcript_5855:717-1076(-)
MANKGHGTSFRETIRRSPSEERLIVSSVCNAQHTWRFFTLSSHTLNTIRVARWELQEKVCDFVGPLGDDEFGCILEQSLVLGGVKPHFQRVDDKPTGTCALCVYVVDRECSLLEKSAPP